VNAPKRGGGEPGEPQDEGLEPLPAEFQLVFLGCGEATRMHSRTLGRLAPEVGLRFASRTRQRAEEFRRRFGGVAAYGSYEEALGDPEVDVALVATPPSSHRELTLRALETGKHVIVEKPAFPRPEEFEEVREAAEVAERRVLVAENYHYKPLRKRLRRIVTEGTVGRPLFVRVDAVKRQRPGGWRADPERTGGGALLEGGIHWINFMAGLGLEVVGAVGFPAGPGAGVRGGAPERAEPKVGPGGDEGPGRGADPSKPAGGRGVRTPPDARDPPAVPAPTEESVLVVLRYAGGAVGTLSYSWEVPSPLKGIRISKIYGTEGSVTFESNGIFVFLRGRRTRLHVPRPWDIGGYRGMFSDFVEALRTGRKPAMTLEMAERDVRLVREAYDDRVPFHADEPAHLDEPSDLDEPGES